MLEFLRNIMSFILLTIGSGAMIFFMCKAFIFLMRLAGANL